MRDEDDAYRVHLNAGSGQAPHDSQPRPDSPQALVDVPFCLGILGDFSGRESRSEVPPGPNLDARPLVRVTPENVLQFGTLYPRVRIRAVEGISGPEDIELSTFEDFHPEHLCQRLAVLEPYRLARQRLLAEEAGVSEEAGALEEDGLERESGSDSEADPETPPAREDSTTPPPMADLLDAVLDETREELAPGGTRLDDDLDGFIRQVVRPHVIASGPDRTDDLKALDLRVSHILSNVIHEPGFQALESLWRSVVFLLSRIEVSSKLRVYLIDISKSELESDLLDTDEPSDWSLGGLFFNPVSENGEELRWAGLIGAYTFGQDPEDVPLLQRIGMLAEAAEVPWFSGGGSALLGYTSVAETSEPEDWTEPVDPRWDELRENPEAGWLSLAFPGFLLRPGYGPGGETGKAFRFTESLKSPADLLWGNPAFLCGIELARAFAKSRWDLRFGRQFSVENVPVHTIADGWASPVQMLLSQTAASRVSDSGLTPILGFRNESAIRLHGVRSISREEKGVRAWWLGHP